MVKSVGPPAGLCWSRQDILARSSPVRKVLAADLAQSLFGSMAQVAAAGGWETTNPTISGMTTEAAPALRHRGIRPSRACEGPKQPHLTPAGIFYGPQAGKAGIRPFSAKSTYATILAHHGSYLNPSAAQHSGSSSRTHRP